MNSPSWLGGGIYYRSFYVASLASFRGLWFLGAGGYWLPLPFGRLAFLSSYLHLQAQVHISGSLLLCWVQDMRHGRLALRLAGQCACVPLLQ